MQLDLLLRTLPPGLNVHVLYRGDPDEYREAVSSYNGVSLCREQQFYDDTLQLIRSAQDDCIMLLTDDTIFITSDVSLGRAREALRSDVTSLVFSLRLGTNTTWCYMLDSAQRPANATSRDGEVLRWYVQGSTGDFEYPFDLSSSIYRRADLIQRIEQLPGRFRNPNELEAMLSRMPMHPNATMLSFVRSVATSVPMNVTQELWTNKHCGTNETCTYALRKAWQRGQRFKIPSKLKTPKSAHECIQFEMEARPLRQPGLIV